VTNPVSLHSSLFHVAYSCPHWLYAILLHVSHDQSLTFFFILLQHHSLKVSNYSSSTLRSVQFQHHKTLCSICNTVLVSSRNLSPIYTICCNINKFCFLSGGCIYVFHVFLRTYSNYLPKGHPQVVHIYVGVSLHYSRK
jgi:hypothetical protein